MTKSKAQKKQTKRAHKGPQKKGGGVRPIVVMQSKPKPAKQHQKSSGSGSQSIGSKIGGAIGGFVQNAATSLFPSIFGKGAYTVKQNTLVSGRPPAFSGKWDNDGSMEFAHSEFLFDVVGSTGFANTSFSVNPGLPMQYPYLSRMAANFEEYELLGQVYEYRATSATALNSTNTALGVVIMTTNYDVLDQEFLDKRSMEAYMFTTSTSPAVSALHPIECAPRMNVLQNMYIRSETYPTGADPRFYDVGLFQLATVGMQAASTIGELWVSYHIRFMKPKLEIGSFYRTAHISATPVDSCTNLIPFGTNYQGAVKAGSTITGLDITQNTFTLHTPGRYLIFMVVIGTGVVITAPPNMTYGMNVSPVNTFFQNVTPAVGGIFNTATAAFYILCVDVTLPGTGAANVFTVVGNTGWTGGTGKDSDVFITQVPPLLSMNAKANLLDKLIARITQLELSSKATKSLSICNNSDTDFDEFKSDMGPSKSTSSKLSDSVVDLIAQKLRK